MMCRGVRLFLYKPQIHVHYRMDALHLGGEGVLPHVVGVVEIGIAVQVRHPQGVGGEAG